MRLLVPAFRGSVGQRAEASSGPHVARAAPPPPHAAPGTKPLVTAARVARAEREPHGVPARVLSAAALPVIAKHVAVGTEVRATLAAKQHVPASGTVAGEHPARAKVPSRPPPKGLPRAPRASPRQVGRATNGATPPAIGPLPLRPGTPRSNAVVMAPPKVMASPSPISKFRRFWCATSRPLPKVADA